MSKYLIAFLFLFNMYLGINLYNMSYDIEQQFKINKNMIEYVEKLNKWNTEDILELKNENKKRFTEIDVNIDSLTGLIVEIYGEINLIKK